MSPEIMLTENLHALDITLEHVARTTSTNSDVLLRARHDMSALPPYLVRVAQEQTAGRGRAGRFWVSDAMRALTFSYGCHWPLRMHDFSGLPCGLPLVAGIGLQRGLAALGAQVQLKWPNDLLFQGRKLGGILVETVVNKKGAYAVIGMGLNLAVPAPTRRQIDVPIADVEEMLMPNDPRKPLTAESVLLVVIPALHHALQQFQQQGLTAFVTEWNQGHAFQDKAVQLFDGAVCIASGIARGIDEYGQLLLDTATGVRRLRSVDISLRPL